MFGGEAPTLNIPKYTWPSDLYPPDYPLEEKTKRTNLRSSAPDGIIQTRSRWQRKHQLFKLHWDVLPTAQKNTMLSFFDTIHGGATAFDWTHPLTNVTYTVRMVGDSLKAEQAAPNVWKVAFDIEEL